MRTSISLEDQVHEYASMYASARGISLSAAINELVRKAQAATEKPLILEGPNGLPMFPPTGRTVTVEMIDRLEEEEF